MFTQVGAFPSKYRFSFFWKLLIGGTEGTAALFQDLFAAGGDVAEGTWSNLLERLKRIEVWR